MKKKPDKDQVPFLQSIIEFNVKAIVEFEESVRVTSDVMPARVVFTVFVDYRDMGLTLGEKGATLDSLRRIVWTACKKTFLKCDIDVLAGGNQHR